MITKKDMYYFHQAAKAAVLSTYKNKKNMTGCVVIYKGNIIAEGYNQDKTDPVQKKYNKFRGLSDNKESPHKIHAEITAIKHITLRDIDWRQVSIYVVRVKKDGTYGMTRPCNACMQYIKEKGIRNIYYSTDDGYAHERLRKWGGPLRTPFLIYILRRIYEK